SDINLKIIPISAQYKANLATTDKFQFELNSAQGAVLQSHLERNTTTDSKGNWTVTVNDAEQINKNIIVESGLPTYGSVGVGIISSQTLSSTKIKLKVDTYNPYDPSVGNFWQYNNSTYGVEESWQNGDLNLITYNAQGNELSRGVIPNMKLQKSGQYLLSMPSEYELPNVVNGSRVYRYEFYYENTTLNKRATFILKNTGLENFPTFNILQIQSNPLNSSYPINVITGVSKITGSAKPNEQLNLYLNGSNTPLNNTPINVGSDGVFEFNWPSTMESGGWRDKYTYSLEGIGGYTQKSNINIQVLFNVPKLPDVNIDNELPGSNLDYKYTYERQFNVTLSNGSKNGLVKIYHKHPNLYKYNDISLVDNEEWLTNGQDYYLDSDGNKNFILSNRAADKDVRIFKPGVFEYKTGGEGYFLEGENQFLISGYNYVYLPIYSLDGSERTIGFSNYKVIGIKVLPHQKSKLTYNWQATGGETNNPNFSPLKDYFQQSNQIKMNVGIDPSKKVGEGDRKADLFFAKSGNAIKINGKSHPGSQIKLKVYKYSGFDYTTNAPVGGQSTIDGILRNIYSNVSEKGSSNSRLYDNWVNILKNTLSGVEVDAIYSTTATNDGNWSIDINTITPNANQFYFQLIENVTPSIASSIFNTNSYTETMMGSVYIDNTAPDAPIITNSTNKFYRDITIIGKAEPLSTVKATLTYNNNVYNFDSFTGTNGVFKILIPKQLNSNVNLPTGTYSLTLSASDRANNESSPYSYNFEIVPVLPLTIDYTEKSNINQTVFVNSSTLTATSGIVNLSSFTDLDFNNVKINLSKNLVKTKLFWSVSSGISIENFSSTVQYISKDNGINLVSFNPSYIIKIDGTPIGYVTNAKIELINNAYEITSPLSNDFEIIPYFVLPASSNQANTNTPFFGINSNLNFTRIAIEKLLNKLTFNSSTYQYNSEILSDNIFSIIAEISGSVNTLIEAREINLLDVDEIVPNIDLVVSSISDTHREDRSPLASFDNSVFSDPDKADKFKIQLVRFETFQGQEPSLSNGNTAIPFTLNAGLSNIANLYKVLDLNSPVELQQGTNTFTTSYGDFKINISSTEWPFNNANITASFQPKNINQYDGAEIYIKFHLKFVRSGNSAPTSDPIYTYKWNIVGTTDIPKISYVNKLTNSNTIYRDDDFAIKSNNLSGISILQNASFDAVDYAKSFTKLKVQFNGFDPLLNEGFVVGNKILDVNSVVSKYTAKINNGILNLTGNTNKLLTLKIKDKNNTPIVTSNSNATGLFTINTALTQLSAYDKKMDFYLYKNNVIQTGIAIEIQIQVGTYIETFSAVSDTEGKVTIQLGTGQVTAGSISGIDWATSPVITTKVRGGGADNLWNYTYQTREASLFLELPYEEIDARNNITYSTLKCYFNQEIQQPLYKINASGYGFVVLSKNTPSGTTSDSEAVTELVFPSKITRSELESFLNNLQYDIKYAGQNVLTSGLRTIKFLQIQKEATDRFKNNQLRYFDLTDYFYINVEGNAEAYFENRGPKSLTIGGTTWNGTTPFNLFPSFRIDLNPLPSNLQNWNLKINPSVDIVSTDVYTFKDTQFTLDESSNSLKYNGQIIGTFIKNADFINFTFNQNATVAYVENMMKSFGYYSTNQDPAEYSCIINLSLNHPTDQNIFVEGVKIFFVFPENDAPKMSFVSQNKSYASGQKTTSGYTSVDLFKVAGQNGSLTDLDIVLDPIESSQIISSIKFKINASNTWLNYTESFISQPAEFFKIGGVEYRLITQSFTQNGFDFSFTLNGNELSVVISNPGNKSKTDLLSLIKGMQYINKAPSTASPNPTRTITFFEVKDDGPQDDVSLINPPGNVNTTTYTGSNGLNKIVITLDPQAKVNVPPTLLKFAPLDNPTIQHEANRDVSNSLFTSLQVNGGFEE
ncbi:MAG: Bacterial Ig-like domain, partial [Bacteroidota bacterium]